MPQATPVRTPPLILASSSRWRRELLDRFGIDYQTISPDVDETARTDEFAYTLVQRLAVAKAQAVFDVHADSIVIGSDQVADLDGQIIGKPGNRETAIEQLQRQSGRTVLFHTGVAVLAPGLAQPLQALVTVKTIFRELELAEIERYVDAEDVTSTAGSIKSEGLGITLVKSIQSDDPSALIGLPLIALRQMLAQVGLVLP